MPRFSLDSDDQSDNDSPSSFSSNDHNTQVPSVKLSMQNDCAIGHRVHASRSVLAVALDEQCVFAGLQGGDILAWSLDTYELVLSVPAHGESVLSLFISPDGQLLFSSGGDSVVNVWSTTTFERLYSIYSHHDVGDIFAVVYSQNLNTVFCGGQNTSLQWCNLASDGNVTISRHPSERRHRFFDSRGPGGSINPRSEDSDAHSLADHRGKTLTFKRDQHRLFSHHGYIYCMIIVRGLIESAPSEEVLLTGSGDGTVKLWRLTQENNGAPIPWFELENGDDAVLSLAIEGSLLYCGLAGGALNIWNLDSQQLVKQITEHQGDLWALDIMNGIAIAGDAQGIIKKFNSSFEEIGCWTAHEGTILASTTGISNNRHIYATGGNDNTVAIWDLATCQEDSELQSIGNDDMVNTLFKFVSYQTISSSPKFSVDCNQGATFLRRHCAFLGATTKLLQTGADTNPVVYARFSASNPGPNVKTILFYGHYDVVGADNNQPKWRTDPFQLVSVDGYLYGRGVSDNKGPILAAVYAAADLVRRKALGCDVVFIIEGEEESGSQGFEKAVRKNKDLIGKVDWILLANSYWLDDHIPCLTYGLRGVVHANLIVTSDHPDLHSGIDGSSLLDEPLKDLSLLLSNFIGRKGHINFPNFYDPVAKLNKAEEQRFQAITEAMLPLHPQIEDREAFTKSLMYRWREPSFTVHSIEVPSNKNTGSTISRRAKATLSVRIVPNQTADEVASALTAFAQEQFDLLDSQNELTIEITGKSDPWLGDPDNEIFGTLAEAISAAWTPDLDEKRYSYPQPSSKTTMRPFGAELNRTDSNDSVASHIDRIISSSTISSKKRSQRKQSASNATAVPTSSTLTGNQARTNSSKLNDAEHGEDSLSSSPSLLSLPTHHSNGNGIPYHGAAASSPPSASAWPTQTETAPSPVQPLYIREGGSIPTIRFLEREFSAPAANLPCGQASDHAHLDNERLRVMNLYKSREIFGWVFEKLPQRVAK
ncbi:WD repeat protein [Talaromyces stipitatus ATCC 10500]|uniref:WD repeat protein n=1 Tax=Talaromyces stipitatus (strain ATCC 10500 / CBS 375.48 / QM 6759 / NRRL 1006) TaxID=441959 RepID=B8LV46_TALSN|nr:WD repeat protein [Talaromyces stipitatus ATCC 10500]EED23096.1 WD repeat protein [Talaromyces stipitatus ATCC 10500]